SLLPVGVKSVEGHFQRGEMVVCFDQQGQEVARGLINYPINEAHRIVGKPSQKIESILGYMSDESLIHRDNLILS
ncbi:MAG: PUA domain-containing protein, partial [Pseudomonadota bacterium]|nr:PUA domain-containing protein [Pseudomonadota bacterium]